MNLQTASPIGNRINDLSYQVIGLCLEVHRNLGPGLLESVYEEAVSHELRSSAIPFVRQHPIPVVYKGVALDCGFRADLIVEDQLILELKSVAEITAIHQAQILTHLRLSRRSLGLLINFNVPILKDGIRRVVAGSLFESD